MRWKFWKKNDKPVEVAPPLTGIPVYDAIPAEPTPTPPNSRIPAKTERNKLLVDRFNVLTAGGYKRWTAINAVGHEFSISPQRVHQILLRHTPGPEKKIGPARIALDLDRVKADYEEVGNVEKVAKLHGVSGPTISSRLREMGVPLARPSVGFKHHSQNKRRRAAAMAVKDGLTRDDIAGSLKMSRSAVDRAVSKFGARIRPRSPWDSSENVQVLRDMWQKPERYSVEDIAALLDCTPGAVRMKARRESLPARKEFASRSSTG